MKDVSRSVQQKLAAGKLMGFVPSMGSSGLDVAKQSGTKQGVSRLAVTKTGMAPRR